MAGFEICPNSVRHAIVQFRSKAPKGDAPTILPIHRDISRCTVIDLRQEEIHRFCCYWVTWCRDHLTYSPSYTTFTICFSKLVSVILLQSCRLRRSYSGIYFIIVPEMILKSFLFGNKPDQSHASGSLCPPLFRPNFWVFCPLTIISYLS